MIVVEKLLTFEKQDADEVAAQAFRFHHYKFESANDQVNANAASRPLEGKEDELLRVLQEASEVYWDWKGILEGLKQLHDVRRSVSVKSSKLAEALDQAVNRLATLNELERAEFDEIAIDLGASVELLEQQLFRFIELARDVEIETKRTPPKRGRTLGIGTNGVWLVPLEEFAKVVRPFWMSITGKRFSYDVAPRAPLEVASAPARLLYFACRKLDRAVEPAHIEAVVEAVERNPKPRPERWCQSAFKFDPVSASNFDPFERRVLVVALAPSELVGVAETVRLRDRRRGF
ncbi:hypothetical protein ACVWWK_001554 [Bradyrhizobium sp. LB9.1b]